LELSWESIKGDDSFIFIFKKLLEDSNISNFAEVIEKKLPGIADIKRDYHERYIGIEKTENLELVINALETALEITTCLKFDKLQEAYNAFADKDIRDTKQKIVATNELAPAKRIFDCNQYVLPPTSVSGNADENRDYDEKKFEKFVQEFFSQLLVAIEDEAIPGIIHTIAEQRKINTFADVKEHHLNEDRNRLSFIHIIYFMLIINTPRLAYALSSLVTRILEWIVSFALSMPK